MGMLFKNGSFGVKKFGKKFKVLDLGTGKVLKSFKNKTSAKNFANKLLKENPFK